MFTGLVEAIGEIDAITPQADQASVLRITAPVVLDGTGLGDSIAVNGVCLTVTSNDGRTFTADVMAETNRRSAIGDLQVGDKVNLERAMRADARLGGHIVQGHVDGVGRLTASEPTSQWTNLTFEVPDGLAPYIAEKGSIAVNGVSLTVTGVSPLGDPSFVDDVNLGRQWFSVSLIPTTLAETTLGGLAVGDPVNLEVDVIAKYVERLNARAQR